MAKHLENMHDPEYAFDFIKGVSDTLIKAVPHAEIYFTPHNDNDFSLNVGETSFSQVNGQLKGKVFLINFNISPNKFLEKLNSSLEEHLFQCNSFMGATAV